MNEIITALIMGLTGSVHCLTMCGSLSVALGFSIPKSKVYWHYAVFVSIGRVFGYGILGFVANLLSQSIVKLSGGGVFYLSILSGLLMMGVGLHLLQISNFISKIEVIGGIVNRKLEPIKRKLLPIDSLTKCLAYGLLWGFLPCGLVYTALTLSLLSPNPSSGFLVMVVFGITTLPAVVGMTVFSNQLVAIFNHKAVRLLFGLIIFFIGIYQIGLAFNKLGNIAVHN